MATSWSGYPAELGFGQREGLTLSGTFSVPASWAPGPEYRALPWPTARDAAEASFHVGRLLDATGPASARCETAGNNVLYAQAVRPCDQPPAPNDLVVCVADLAAHVVRVHVQAAY